LREFWSTIVGGRGTVRERPGYRTILDLGTEQIKALVLELEEDEALVVGVGRARHQQGWGGTGAVVDIQTMARSCDQALRQAEDMTAEICDRQVVPDWVVVGLPNSLTVAQAFAVTHHRSSPAKRIGDKELRGVVQRAQRLALRQVGRKIERVQGSQEAKVELLESAVTDMRVDGHSVTNPLGFRGQKLTVAVFNVVVSSSYLRGVEAVTKDLGLEVLTKVSGWQALAYMLGEREGICIDVGGKATDVVLVRNGKAWATASLPLGGSGFTKHVAETFGLSWSDAESLKLAYTRGTTIGSSQTEMTEAIGRVMRAWLGGVETALRRLSGSEPVPHQFNLCGGGSSLPGMVEAVRSHPWTQALSFRRHPQVRLLQPGDVSGVLDRTGWLGGRRDVASLALAGYTMAADAEEDSLECLLRRVKRPAIFGNTEAKA
jgi:cell division protein FtsA